MSFKQHTDGTIEIGEFNAREQLQGRGIRIEPNKEIKVGWWDKNWHATGNFFRVYPDGNFNIGKF